MVKQFLILLGNTVRFQIKEQMRSFCHMYNHLMDYCGFTEMLPPIPLLKFDGNY